MMKRAIIVVIFLLCSGVLLGEYTTLRDFQTGKAIPYGGKQQGGAIKISTVYMPKSREFRGIWVATVENIDFSRHNTVADFKRDYLEIVNRLKELNFNVIIFQVRPMNDAFYPSKLNPWSRYLTGTEGRGLEGFDPLKFMIEEAHKRGLEFHAWLNPYRVINSTPLRKGEYLKTLSPQNFARKRPDLVLEVPLASGQYQLILNPGEPEVVNFLLHTVKEILQNYAVDAIHFDDYFYPYTDIGSADAATYRKHNPNRLSLENWRRNNVDTLIFQLNMLLNTHNKLYNREVQLGISPFGIWANKKSNPNGSLTLGSESYSRQYADTRKWVKQQWIDYIVPQLYWPFSHSAAPYAALTDWWCSQVRGTRVNLYIGMAAYQLGSSGAWKNADELAAQMRYNCVRPEVKGVSFFSYKSIANPSNTVMQRGGQQMLRNYWKKAVPTPSTLRKR